MLGSVSLDNQRVCKLVYIHGLQVVAVWKNNEDAHRNIVSNDFLILFVVMSLCEVMSGQIKSTYF